MLARPIARTRMLLVLMTLVAAMLRVATPLLYAALGETITERAGVLNLGIEGTMLIGAFAGFVAAALTMSLWIGLLAAMLVGMLCGLLMALLTVTFGLNQHVSGLGMTLLATGMALFAFRLMYGTSGVQARIDPFQQIEPPTLLGPLAELFHQYLLTYLGFGLVPLIWWVLYRTRFGLKLRAVGENPEAADMAGVNVFRFRYIALIAGGALMGIAGAFLSLAQLGAFTFGIIAGRGWVAVALVIFGNWNPIKVFAGALLFGMVQAIQLRLQAEGIRVVPYEVLLALPYLVTIAALVIASRNASYPAALLKPYRRE
jgi:general nucleoside transport system permease protein